LVRLRVVDRDLILHDVLRDALDALDELEIRTVAVAVAVYADRRLAREVRRLDDELVAFPVTDRVAEDLADLAADVRTAVRRIDDERGLREGAARVVETERADGGFVALLGALRDLALPGRVLLVGLIQPIAERRRPRHREARIVVARPHADEVGLAPGCL